MKILIIAATKLEINSLSEFYNNNIKSKTAHQLDFLIAGIGSVSSTYELNKYLARNKTDLIINIGIAGAFTKKLAIGEVVQVVSDTFADLGIDDNGVYKSIYREQLVNPNEFPFQNGIMYNHSDIAKNTSAIKSVNGITLNTVSGSEKKIQALKKLYNADIETMEGAAIFFTCLKENLDFIQIRSISNYIEPRNKENWQIEKAIDNLQQYIIKFIKELEPNE